MFKKQILIGLGSACLYLLTLTANAQTMPPSKVVYGKQTITPPSQVGSPLKQKPPVRIMPKAGSGAITEPANVRGL